MHSGDYSAALAHLETAASLHRPDEHRDSAFRYGQDIGVSAFVMLSWALWHHGYPYRSARAADRAVAYSRELGHAHTLAHALGLTGLAAVFARDWRVPGRQPLGHCHQIGHDAKLFRGKRRAGAPKSVDHLVHNQQHAMRIADRPHPLPITRRWDMVRIGHRDGLTNHCRNRVRSLREDLL